MIFNALKHHLGFIKNYIVQHQNQNIAKDLLKIGTSQMDLYIGKLTTEAIFEEIQAFLIAENMTDFEAYKQRISKHNGFFTCTLSDSSEWTFILGDTEGGDFLHIHPSRYAPHTMRIKAGALKTAIAYLAQQNKVFSTENINQLRSNIGLSPIRNAADLEGVKRILELINV